MHKSNQAFAHLLKLRYDLRKLAARQRTIADTKEALTIDEVSVKVQMAAIQSEIDSLESARVIPPPKSLKMELDGLRI